MSTYGLTEAIARAIERLGRISASSSPNPEIRAAATRGSGLPVYHDMGGVLVLRPDGVVVHYDPETDRVQEVDDEGALRWRTHTLLEASRRFPELRRLHPPRPDNTTTCDPCGGSGVLFDELTCAACLGTGWLPVP